MRVRKAKETERRLIDLYARSDLSNDVLDERVERVRAERGATEQDLGQRAVRASVA